jgi:succinate-semialdehyde dehydrogenase/glutarate-semialdehyde dehydrogenase
MFRSIDPSTGKANSTHELASAQQVEAALETSHEASITWRYTPVGERAARLQRLAKVLRDELEPLARTITREVGKPIHESRAEVEKCAWTCDVVANTAPGLLDDEPADTNATRSWVSYEPLGPILAIMPWNYPVWQTVRAAAPALAAGNTVVLKHAPNVPESALALTEIFHHAGFGEGVFTNLFVDVETTGALIMDPRIAGVTLTGSVGAGRAVARLAGEALKPVVLELGGSDPFIVLADADLDAAVAGAIRGRFGNCGQSCVASKRFIVEAPIHDAFVERLDAAIGDLQVGDPLDELTRIGPMVREDLRAALHDQVRRSVEAGATLVRGGAPLERPGYYYAPTLLTDVKPGMASFEEEVFGPVASVTLARDADHAVALADRTRFGLGASIWSTDEEHALALGRRIHSGLLAINDIVKSDPRLPFGGVRESGIGRELAAAGVRAFVNVRAVWTA